MLRSTLLEVQVLYWMPLPGRSDEALQRNLMNTYYTCEGLVKLALDLERKSGFLTHAPHYAFRSLLLAGCTITSYLRSPFRSTNLVPVGGEDLVVQNVILALKTCSVQADDLPIRGSNVMEAYWSVRDRLPPWDTHQLRNANFKHRLGASIVYDCLGRWKKDLEWTRASAGDPTPAGGPSESYSSKLSLELNAVVYYFMLTDYNFQVTLLLLLDKTRISACLILYSGVLTGHRLWTISNGTFLLL
jgi:hypothetical protein